MAPSGGFLEGILGPYMPWFYKDSYVWTAIGLAGNGVFSARFLVQWLTSEKKKKLVVPPIFWHLSFWGSLISLIYAFHIDKLPIILGFVALPFIYGRNLVLLKRTHAAESGTASESLNSSMLTNDEKRTLLRLARATIEAAVEGRPRPSSEEPLSSVLERPGAAFVTLHSRGDLRGCIGTTEPVEPLHRTIASVAVSSALRDPRFPPVSPAELPELELEISVLTPRVPVSDPSEIEVGRDGLVVSMGGRGGLLLPQVAEEYGWDRETFLRQTCIKAGLAGDAWKDPRCRIERFSAEVFGENELHS